MVAWECEASPWRGVVVLVHFENMRMFLKLDVRLLLLGVTSNYLGLVNLVNRIRLLGYIGAINGSK